MIELRLNGSGPFELHVEGRLHLFKELLVSVEASQDRFDDRFDERLDDRRYRVDGYRRRLAWSLPRHGLA